jgi:hypothetical protein
MVRDTVTLLFHNGYHIRLFVQNPKIPAILGCEYQEQAVT